MITAKELVEPIEIMAPPCTQSRWDNSGFSVGATLLTGDGRIFCGCNRIC